MVCTTGSLVESSVLGCNALDARMSVLVEVPAAVEDALALLLLQPDALVQVCVCVYVGVCICVCVYVCVWYTM